MPLPLYRLSTGIALRAAGAHPRRLEIANSGRISLRYWSHPARTRTEESPPPAVFLHGMGSTVLSWLPVLRRLAPDSSWLAPELSALGGTRAPARGLSIPQAVAATAALLDREGVTRACLVGSSLGGWMAVRFALAHPQRVARLVLVNAGGYFDQDWDAVSRLVAPRTRRDVAAFTRALFFHPPWYEPVARDVLYAVLRSRVVTDVIDTIGAADTYDAADLRRLQLPALLLWGERDGIFPPEIGRRIADALPDSRFEIVAGTAHACQWERPDEVARQIESFAEVCRAPG
ncbi:MAG: alpha/beta fold hydrolase [Acidobacteriota bacterium]